MTSIGCESSIAALESQPDISSQAILAFMMLENLTIEARRRQENINQSGKGRCEPCQCQDIAP
jgi:hypothetical protein